MRPTPKPQSGPIKTAFIGVCVEPELKDWLERHVKSNGLKSVSALIAWLIQQYKEKQ